MTLITRGLALAALGLGVLGLVGCGEDNEAASRDSSSKSTATVDPNAPPPPTSNQYPSAPSAGAGTGGGYPGAKAAPKKK